MADVSLRTRRLRAWIVLAWLVLAVLLIAGIIVVRNASWPATNWLRASVEMTA